MNKIYRVLLLLLPVLALVSCEREYSEARGGVVLTAPELNPLASSSWSLERPGEGADPLAARVSWSKAKFSYESGEYIHAEDIKYTLEIDLADNDFVSPVVLGETSELYFDVHRAALKAAIDQLLGEESAEEHNFNLRVRSESSHGLSISNLLPVSIKSYLLVDPFVSNVYLIGDMNGWDPSSTDYILFRNSNDYKDGEYTYTGYFPKETYFKMVSEENLGGYDKMYCAGENGELTFGDLGAFYVEAGYHTITINTLEKTWKIESFDGASKPVFQTLGPIGGFSGWDNEPLMTQSSFDPHQWRLEYEFTESTAVKFRADHDWAKNWGGNDLDFPYGHAVFDGPGASLNEAGTYKVYFNDLTGHYVLIKK